MLQLALDASEKESLAAPAKASLRTRSTARTARLRRGLFEPPCRRASLQLNGSAVAAVEPFAWRPLERSSTPTKRMPAQGATGPPGPWGVATTGHGPVSGPSFCGPGGRNILRTKNRWSTFISRLLAVFV